MASKKDSVGTSRLLEGRGSDRRKPAPIAMAQQTQLAQGRKSGSGCSGPKPARRGAREVLTNERPGADFMLDCHQVARH